MVQVDFPFPKKNTSKSQPSECTTGKRDMSWSSFPSLYLTATCWEIDHHRTNPAKVTGKKGNWWLYMGVSKNSGTPKSSILIGFSLINHPFWGTPIFRNTHICVSFTYRISCFWIKWSLIGRMWWFMFMRNLTLGIRFLTSLRNSSFCWDSPIKTSTWQFLMLMVFQSCGTVQWYSSFSHLDFYHPNWCRISTIHKMRCDFFQKNGINGSGAGTSTQARPSTANSCKKMYLPPFFSWPNSNSSYV